MSEQSILQPGRNCWRLCHAERVAFLIDGAAYFSALHAALQMARRQVLILSWDIYSRLKLAGDSANGRYPELATLLNDLVDRQRGLRVFILSWDFSMLFALDREWIPTYQLDWKTHRRVRFEMDDNCPPGASHHQKVVVIDDRIAFSGGLDLTRGRWDTPEHRPHDPRRMRVDGTRGRPYHDVQLAVTGPAAAALGALARERWRRATGERLTAPEAPNHCGPLPGLHFDLEDVEVGIVRTEPAANDAAAVREVEQLYLDAIAVADAVIYIENQYFTSTAIARALRERLAQAHGPEVILNLPLATEGWLANKSMDVIRTRLIAELRAADVHHRFAVYYPGLPDAGDHPVNLHAKVMIVDDRLARVGSSNLNNRSMGLDTECDLAIEAGDGQQRVRTAIREFRNRLLAEHLDVSPGQLDAAQRRSVSLIGAIEALRTDGRTLEPLEPHLEAGDNGLLTETALVDPERPVDTEALLKEFVPGKKTRPAGLRLLGWGLALTVLTVLAALWRFTPLGDWLDIPSLLEAIDVLRAWPGTPVLLVAGFVVAGFLLIPLTALIIATIVAFGTLPGFVYSMLGALASALAAYGVGAGMGRRSVRRLAGRRANRISRSLARRGLLTIIVVRIVPVAPFTVVNLVAGASHIRFRDFVLGTLLGMLPGTLAIALLVDRVSVSLQAPDTENILSLIAVAVAVLVAAVVLSRRLLRRARQDASPRED